MSVETTLKYYFLCIRGTRFKISITYFAYKTTRNRFQNIADENSKWYNTFERNFALYSKGFTINTAAVPTCRNLTQDILSQMWGKKICTMLFTQTLFIKENYWKHPKCPATGNWCNKLWYIHTWNTTNLKKKGWGRILWITMKLFSGILYLGKKNPNPKVNIVYYFFV